MKARENRLRRMTEILWALVVILIVMTFFNVCTWPLLSNASTPAPPKPAEDVGAPAPEEKAAVLLQLTLDKQGRVRIGNKVLSAEALRAKFKATAPTGVAIEVASPAMLLLFSECSRLGISPDMQSATR